MTNQSALEQLKSERENAPALYAELLDPAREPQAGDGAELREIMVVLGLTPEQVEQHRKAREQAASLAELDPQIAELDEQYQQAAREVINEYERFREEQMKHVERLTELQMNSTPLDLAGKKLKDEQRKIVELRRLYPIAFGIDE